MISLAFGPLAFVIWRSKNAFCARDFAAGAASDGGPQGAIAIENILDSVARALGRDALDVRRANFYPHKDARPHRATPYGMTVEDCIIQDLFDDLETSAGYQRRRAAIRGWNRANPILKRISNQPLMLRKKCTGFRREQTCLLQALLIEHLLDAVGFVNQHDVGRVLEQLGK